MQAPAFYTENNISKVKWMYPGKCYYARLMTVPLKYDQARLYIYVLNDQHVIAYRDEQMTDELGMLKLKHFLQIKELSVEEAPVVSSVFPISLTYGMLLDVPKDKSKEPEKIVEVQKEPVQPPIEVKVEPVVKVTILPPEPAVQYEQLALF